MKRSALVVLMLCLVPASARANPIMVGGWISACQVNGTRNVVLSYTCGEASNANYGECSVGDLTRDGQGVGARWATSSYADDLGSGVSGTLFNGTVCDCNVPAGERTYDTSSFNTSIMVAQVGTADGTWCDPSTVCDCSSTDSEADQGGCAVAPSAGPDLLVLALLVLGLVWARRRR